MRRIHILCAVRDSRVPEHIRKALGDRCDVQFASGGDAALAASERLTPDILVIDAVLPYLDGPGVIDRMRARLGERMPVVIGGSVQGFSNAAFARRGVQHVACVPWDAQALVTQLREMIQNIDTQIDWVRAETGYHRAAALLTQMGMNERLHGFSYLSWAAALACDDEGRLDAIRERIYAPIAKRQGTTDQNVERLIRHAVERTTDTVGVDGIYTFFGNTIDPMRGKPTNAQMIAMLAQRLRILEGA